MSWKFMLGTEGAINSLLTYVVAIAEPLEGMIYSRTAGPYLAAGY